MQKEVMIDEFLFSTQKARLNIPYIHQFLSERSYWAKGVPLKLLERSVENSVCIGIYHGDCQIGFSRIITDTATFAYLADVFIDENYRGKGLSKRMMEFIFSFEEMKVLRRFMLATRDAHSLYSKYGFTPLSKPDRFMEKHQPDIYQHIDPSTV